MTANGARKPQTATGLSRSVSLLRALGAKAAPVWAELDPQEANLIAEAMDDTPTQSDADTEAASALLQAAQQETARPGSIWERLSALNINQLGSLLENEHPQVMALALSRLTPQAAAGLVRQFPELLATDVLKRMLNMGAANNRAIAAIEKNFEARIATLNIAQPVRPDETVARIFDAMPESSSETYLQALQSADPGAGERIRVLMFSFGDLARLAPAGLQTLLSRTDRTLLTLALKGAPKEVAAAFFTNMTSRAGEVLREEIAALGPRPRSEVEAARADLVSLTRKLIDAGEIYPAGAQVGEDLIE